MRRAYFKGFKMTADLMDDIADRLESLDCAMQNANGYKYLLEDFRTRPDITGPHMDSVKMIHSAFVRATVVTIMAPLDNPGDDRCSVAQILLMMEAADLTRCAPNWSDRSFGPAELQRVREEWNALKAMPEFRACKAFRDARIAHNLTFDAAILDHEMHATLGGAEKLTTRLYAVYGAAPLRFPSLKPKLQATAKLF